MQIDPDFNTKNQLIPPVRIPQAIRFNQRHTNKWWQMAREQAGTSLKCSDVIGIFLACSPNAILWDLTKDCISLILTSVDACQSFKVSYNCVYSTARWDGSEIVYKLCKCCKCSCETVREIKRPVKLIRLPSDSNQMQTYFYSASNWIMSTVNS